MMAKRTSTHLILIGVVLFIVGAGLAFALVWHARSGTTRHLSSRTAHPSTPATVPGDTRLAAPGTPAGPLPFAIPAGQTALAVQMQYFAGGGGFARAGSLVDIYAVIHPHSALPPPRGQSGAQPPSPPTVKLVLANVRVLEALGSPPAATGQPGSFLLALTPDQAEEVIFYASFDSLYMSLVPENAAPAATSGHTYANSY